MKCSARTCNRRRPTRWLPSNGRSRPPRSHSRPALPHGRPSRPGTSSPKTASIYDDIQFTPSYDASDRHFLEWDGHALGHAIAGVPVLSTRDDGAIVEVRIHHRPLPALLAFAAELDRRLTAA